MRVRVIVRVHARACACMRVRVIVRVIVRVCARAQVCVERAHPPAADLLHSHGIAL